MESTVCRVCGKSLIAPESVKRGIGPTCAARVNQAIKDYKETEEAEGSEMPSTVAWPNTGRREEREHRQMDQGG